MYEAQDDSYTSLAYIASTISCEAATAAAEAAQKTRLLGNKKDQLEREREGRIERDRDRRRRKCFHFHLQSAANEL